MRCCSWLWFSCIVELSAACQTARAQAPGEADVRVRVARAELRRESGLSELIELAARGATSERVLALRGLGRIGAPVNASASPVRSRSIEAMLSALQDPAPEVVAAAAEALGLVAAIDGVELGVDAELTSALARAGEGASSVLWALGVAAGAAAQPALVAALAQPRTAEVAALALGRHGRREIPLGSESRAALVAISSAEDPPVRQAAVYALAREVQPPDDPAVRSALWERTRDAVPAVRAQAINALGRRKLLATAAESCADPEPLLYDRDFRVGVEAVRALAGSADTRASVASALGRLFGALARGADPALAQVITEGERVLQSSPLTEADQEALSELAAAARQARALPALTRGWVECLAEQGVVRAQSAPDYAALQGCGLPDAWRLPLVAELVDAGVGSLAARRNALAGLLAHADARVRGAGVGALGSLAKAGEDADRSYAGQQLTAALNGPDLVVTAAAVDAAPAVYEALGTDGQAALDAALLARVQREQDPEVGAALLSLVGDRKLSAGAPSCRAALAGNPVLAAAGAACLQALGESSPERAAVAALPALPTDIAVERVIGRSLRWHLETTRGEIVIGLRPDVAPWTVATIAALTQRGAYDGLAFHRVVPNFVVQGGDPTESGYGGPGFAVPVEPATPSDSAGFERAGVGVADAGRDSGGSQFFIMQGAAPYLDGRYTWFGTVVRGQRNADALLMGDAVKRARIEVVREP